MKNTQIISQINKQSGFVLVLALVMLTVLTLIGVSSMNSANMELRATSNARQHQVAFAAAQALMDYAKSDPGVRAINYLTKTPNSVTDLPVAGASAVSAAVSYAGCSVAIGSSLEEGKGFSYNFYTVAGTASNATGTATSLQTEGVRNPAAGCL